MDMNVVTLSLNPLNQVLVSYYKQEKRCKLNKNKVLIP